MVREQIGPALRSLVVLSLLTGVAYPAVITAIAQTTRPYQANGSLIMRHGRVAGSVLIGQPFSDPRYFWGRLSATAPTYNAAASSGSNLGPLNPALVAAVKDRISALHVADPGNASPIPVDLVTASASGLDPHISPAAARYQARRVAHARGVSEAKIEQLINQHLQPRAFGMLGEPVVNVLTLNLALDDSSSR